MNKCKKTNQLAQNESASKVEKDVTTELQPTKEGIERDRRLRELNQLRVTTQTVLPPVKSVISIDGVPFFELDDLGAIKAKQKAGKTTALKVMAAAWMKGELFRLKSEVENAKILWLDTEQKKNDVKKIIDDVKQLSGVADAYLDNHLKLYTVRTLSYKTLLEDTMLLISAYRPHVVIIDGLVDYIESFNDETLSHRLINELVVLSDRHHCAIINVLHTNKGSDDHNMRGHLGTMLAQKAGTVVECAKDKNGVITVSCSDARHAAMPSWKIMYNESGNIIQADGSIMTVAQQERQRKVDVIKKTIQDSGGSIVRKELTSKLMAALNLSRTRVSNLISENLGKTICEDGNMIKIQPEMGWIV